MGRRSNALQSDRASRQEELDILFGVINRFIGHFTRQAVPRTGNDITTEYPFVAMDTRQAYEQLLFVRAFLQETKMFRPGLRFIDIGCGIGNILLIAEQLEFEVFGIEKDPASLAIARELIGPAAVDEIDIWQYDGLADFDVLYYFRPFCEKTMQLRFEKHVEDACSPGAVIIANRKMATDIDANPRFIRLAEDLPIWQKNP